MVTINYSPVTRSKVDVEATSRCTYRLFATSAYSICAGVVIYVGQQHPDTEYSVVVQFDVNSAIMYSALNSVDVGINDIVDVGQRIGTAQRCFEFVCAISAPVTSHPIRVQQSTYYKIDSLSWIDGSRKFPTVRPAMQTNSAPYKEPVLGPDADQEFSDGR